MIYYVAVQEENGNYLVLNIKDSGFFDQPSTYQDYCQCTLGEINEYTTRYQDENLLKRCLLSEGILAEKNIERPLVILEVDTTNEENWRVLGEPLYEDSREYIQDIQAVKEYFRGILPLLEEDTEDTHRILKAAKLSFPMFEPQDLLTYRSNDLLAYQMAFTIRQIDEIRNDSSKKQQKRKSKKPIVFGSTDN